MDELQARLWGRMISAVEDYESGSIAFGRMVGELEGALDAGGFRDAELVRSFYERWGPLEVLNAMLGEQVSRQEAASSVAEMRRFLVERAPRLADEPTT